MALGQARPGRPVIDEDEDDDELSALLRDADQILASPAEAAGDDLTSLLSEADAIIGGARASAPAPWASSPRTRPGVYGDELTTPETSSVASPSINDLMAAKKPAKPSLRARAREAVDLAKAAGISDELDPSFMPETWAKEQAPPIAPAVSHAPTGPSIDDLIASKQARQKFSIGTPAAHRDQGSGIRELLASPRGAPMQPVASHEPSAQLDIEADPSALDRVTDVGISALKGAIGVPEAAVGLADIVSGGRAGKAAAAAGFDPGLAKQILDTYYSKAQQGAFKNVREADGVLDTIAAALSNPSVIAQSLVESAPAMLAGGGAARLIKAAPWIAGAVGEGAVTAGSAAEQARQSSETGLITPKQSALAAASGVGTSALGIFGGKIAKALGIADVDALLAGAVRSEAAQRGLVKQIAYGAVQEGFLEELPQSVQEQILANASAGRPLDEGVDQAAVLGVFAGVAMGGGAQLTSRASERVGRLPVDAPTPPLDETTTVLKEADEILAAPTPPIVIDEDVETAALPTFVKEQIAKSAEGRGTADDVPDNPVAKQFEAERQAAASVPLDEAVVLAQADELLQQQERAATAPQVTEARSAVPDAPANAKPGEFYTMRPEEIAVDPARFQFKAGVNDQGVTSTAKIEGPWNEARAGVLMVWKDPADGKTWVINGHHRLEAAKRLGAERVAVRYVDAPTAEQARVEGALTNISEDKGTPLDAAKLIRDAEYSVEDLVAAGLSPKSALVRDGIGLARLSDPLFAKVVSGDMDERVGGAIGAAGLSPGGQSAVAQLVDRQTAKGRTLTPAQVRAVADDVAATPEVKAGSAGGQTNIFGLLGEERTQNVAVEKAVLRDWARQQLAQDKRLFGFVTKGDRAQSLEHGGNTIDVEASKAIADEAGQLSAVFDRLAHASGPVSSALNAAAVRIAEGSKAHDVRPELLTALRAAVAAELGPKARQADAGAKGPDREVRVRPHRERRAANSQESKVTEAPREFSSTQVNLPDEVGRDLAAMARAIPDEDLAEDGREDEPHITVKFGLHGNEAEAVRAVLANEPPITVRLGKTSIFPNSESNSGDVVKVDVDSADLYRLNQKIADALPNTDTHPTYQPHATVAYVKPGLGKKYIGRADLEGRTFTIDRVVFSGKDRVNTEIPLSGKRSTAPKDVALPGTEGVRDREQQPSLGLPVEAPHKSNKRGTSAVGEAFPPGTDTAEQFGKRLLAHVQANLPDYVAKYRQRFGTWLNADNASELFPEYSASPASRGRLFTAVRPAASAIIEGAYAEILAEPTPVGKRPTVVFTSGGNGAGKSTGVKSNSKAHVIFDSTLSQVEPSAAKIEQALQSGHEVLIRHVSRDPVDAWADGVLPRAMSPTSPEPGRPVKLGGHAQTHTAARTTLLTLADRYSTHPHVDVVVLENRAGVRKLEPRSVDWLRSKEYPKGDDLRQQIQGVLDEQLAAGRISEALYDVAGGAPRSARPNQPGVRRGVHSEPRGGPEAPRSRANDAEVTSGLPVEPSKKPTSRDAPGLPVTPIESSGSPTRAVFDQPPKDVVAHYRGGRPLSEQQAVEELRRIFALERTGSNNVLDKLGLREKAPLPTRTGKFRQRAFGIYKTDTQMIRLKRAFDLATFTHELGHHIDFARFEKHGRPTGLFKAELMKLGEATTPASKMGGTYQLNEGVAEFFRVWFPDPAAARAAAPTFTAALTDVMQQEPGFATQLRAGQVIVQRYLSQDLTTRGKARINVQRGGSPQRVVKNAVAAAREGATGLESASRVVGSVLDTLNISKAARDPHAAWQAFRKRWVDDLDPINRAVKDMAAHLDESHTFTVADNAYILARVARGTAGRAQGFIEFGVRDTNGQFLGGSLRDAIAPVADRLVPDESGQDQRPDLASYLVALRARELTKSDRPGGTKDPGMKRAEADAIIRAMEADPAFERFTSARDAIYKYQQSLLNYAAETGVFNGTQLKAIAAAGEFYVPLQRVMDEVAAAGSGTARKIADRVSPVKRLKGSGRDIIDPFESIVKNTAVIVDMVEKNKAMQALVRLADKAVGSGQWLEKVPPGMVATTFDLGQVKKEVLKQLFDKTGISPLEAEVNDIFDWDAMVTAFAPQTWGNPQDRIVTVIREGKREFYQVQDEALYQAITAIGTRAASEIVQWAAKPTALLRAAATLMPTFIIRNLIRDTVGAMMQSRHGFIPVYDSLNGFVSMMKNDADWQLYMASGVQQATLLGQDRDRLKSVVDKLGEPKWRRKMKTLAHPLDALRAFSEQIENATRVGEFKLALDAGGRERRGGVLGIAQRLAEAGTARPKVTKETLITATLAARDVTVDFSRGGSTSKEISQFKAFFNARVQGYARIAESMKRDPAGSALTVGALAALSWALWSMNKDDEEYQSLTWRERMDYWWFKLPGNETWVRVAKPHEWGTVPNLIEGALEQVHHEQKGTVWNMSPVNVESRDALAIVASLAPTFILPAMEAATNYDTYRRKNIVSPFDEMNLKPVDQYTDLTSQTMKAIGRVSGLSPAKLEHMFVGYTASAGRGALDLSDTVLAGRIKPREVARRAEQIPVTGTVFKDTSATSYAQPIQDFYRDREGLQQTKGSFKMRSEKGDREGVASLMSESSHLTPEHVARIEMADQAITDLRELRNGIYANKTLTPTQRRKALAGIHRAMVRWAATATFSDTKFDNVYKTPKPPWE